MPRGRIRHLQALAGRIYHLLTKEAAYGPNLHHLDEFREAQKLEKSLESDSFAREELRSPRERGGMVRRKSA
jgi:hypothetical protein